MNAPLMMALVHVNKTVPTLLDHTSAAVVQDTCLELINLCVLVRYSNVDCRIILNMLYVDIDECSTNDGLGSCQQNCTNTIGSYFCSCSSGYTLGDNQSSCIGKVFHCALGVDSVYRLSV